MSDPRQGFIVAGYFPPDLTPQSQRSIEVLAKSATAAVQAVAKHYPEFIPTGTINEEDLQSYLQDVLRVKKPGQKGYIVAGFIRDPGKEEIAYLHPVSSTDSDSAVLAALDDIPSFIPVSAESESRLRQCLDSIHRLRLANPL